ILFPVELVASAVRDSPPLGLWWDTGRSLPHYRWELEAFVFPPVRLRRWDGFRLAMPGEVVVDASIGDSRFHETEPRIRTGRHGKKQRTDACINERALTTAPRIAI